MKKLKAKIESVLTGYTKEKPFEYDVDWEIFACISVVVFIILFSAKNNFL